MLKLLHVDDDEDILEIAKLSLEIFGEFEVVSCVSGLRAMEVVKEFVPEVFLLDVMMPEMTGPETLANLRRVSGLENVPTIFMTARADPDQVQTLMELGALKVISKPFDAMLLSEQIITALSTTNGLSDQEV